MREGILQTLVHQQPISPIILVKIASSMASRTITFVTGNANKLKEVQAILSGTNILLKSAKLDLVEIQVSDAGG